LQANPVTALGVGRLSVRGNEALVRTTCTETNESLDQVDAELVRFELAPNNGNILGDRRRVAAR
jgi:hypothetical protein